MEEQRMCRQYMRFGVCRKKACRFAHIPGEYGNPSQSTQARQPTGNPKRHKKDRPTSDSTEFLSWKNNIPWNPNAARPLGDLLPSFFQEARRLIDIDENLVQNVVRSLSSASGLERIGELIDRNFDNVPLAAKTTVFSEEIVPFLEIIGHTKVLSSLLLEKQVEVIYNFFSAWRGVHLFAFILDALTTPNSNARGELIWHLELSLIVFNRFVELTPTSFTLEPLTLLAKRFEEICRLLGSSESASSLDRIYSYLGRIQSNLEAESSPVAPYGDSSIPIQQQIGGPVSSFDPPGGRHDNDHNDICRVKIMPTSQEIFSPQPEYLPTRDPRQWQVGGVSGLLERNFRLLREDTIGQLRNAIRSGLGLLSHGSTFGNLLKINVYEGARFTGLSFNRFWGFRFDVTFPQPFDFTMMSPDQRLAWWMLSKRLQSDALVCLVDSQGYTLFCTVVGPDREPKPKPGQEQRRKEPEDEIPESLWNDDQFASITLRVVEPNDDSVQYVLDRYRPDDAAFAFSVVEFPGFVLPAFQPTLVALQTMKRSADLPFAEYLAPTNLSEIPTCVNMPPPAYSLKPGFSFDLRCLLNNGMDLDIRPGQPVDIKKLQDNSSLDDAQAVALVDSLQRRIGLIQGPPGTGKSFTGVSLIKVLLANKSKANADIGPIICVCYTNHALDQLLEDLLSQGISQIVRIGARSKSQILEPYNLRNVQMEKTRFEKGGQYHHFKQLEKLENTFDNLRLEKPVSDGVVRTYLREHRKWHYDQLFVSEGNVFQKGPKKSQVIGNWLNSGIMVPNVPPRSLEELQRTHVDQMTMQERKILHNSWVNVMKAELHEKAKQIALTHQTTKADFDKIRDEIDLRCLRSSDVIGVTTSGLARNLNMLRKLESKVVLCEEAGEVLETHLLTALLPSVEHAILIGDHLQLRPQIQNFGLSRENLDGGEKYSLDVSLFERLVEPNNGFGIQVPFSTLEFQRRMHPCISQLIRETLYPQLKDAPFLSNYPPVFGMQRRLFWLDHRKFEARASNNKAAATSYWNDYEIEAVTGLVNHLVQQGGYKSRDIAVLTPYLGQLQRLQQRLGASFAISLGEQDQDYLDNAGFGFSGVPKTMPWETLRVATIDNFQGEEAKVVVVSMVRSNYENNCGFLSTQNRINVLLSRAKHGMYIIGNSETSRHVPMWAHVIDILQRGGNLGTSLELCCPQHPGTTVFVSEPEHFAVLARRGMQFGMYGPRAITSCVCAEMSQCFSFPNALPETSNWM